MDKKGQFLNRKTMRKMKRQEKKEKKNFFYQKKFGGSNDGVEWKSKFDEANQNQNKIFGKNKNLKFFKKQKGEQDEDVNSDEESIRSVNSDLPKNNKNKFNSDEGSESEIEDDFNNDKGGESDTQKKNRPDLNTDLELEINRLEKKLGLKDEKRFQRFKKRVAMENYDNDLFDFLDNIDHVVRETKETKKDISSVKENVKKTKKISEKEGKPKEETPEDFLESKKKEKSKLELLETSLNNKLSSSSIDPNLKVGSRLFSNLKMSDEQKEKLAFQKDITSLLNKISEANLILMFPEFIEKIENFEKSKINKKDKLHLIYETITNVCLKQTIDQEITNLPITSCICSYISVLHYKFGNSFILYFIKSAFEKVEEQLDPNNTLNKSTSHQLKNFMFLIIHFYIFQNFSSKIYYDLIKHFIDNFNEVYSEMLLLLLSYIGIEIRKEDPESIKEIISSVNKKYNLLKMKTNDELKSNINHSTPTHGKLKFIVDMIDDIKNNKYLKFNLSEKFNFFKTFVNLNKKQYEEYDIESKKIADKVEISMQGIKSFDKNKLEDELVMLKENNEENQNDLLDVNEDLFVDKKLLESKMKRYKITTDLKKMIFTSIAGSSDCTDAFEKLSRLNLKKDQEREIIKIILLLVTEEKNYNPFYKLLLNKLITFDKAHKYTFHYTVWDHMKIMQNDSYNLKKIHNLSKLCSDLLVEEKISLPVILNYPFEDADDKQRSFVIMLFDKFFANSLNTSDKCKLLFAKLVKNDDHVEFGKRLFNFFINDFKKEMDVEKKEKEYIERFVAATKVLKRIL